MQGRETMKTDPIYLGIDVSKTKLHLASERRFLKEVTNGLKGIQRIVAFAKDRNPELVVVEATGGYETLLVDSLHDAGIAVHVAQPGCVRHFAQSIKVLAKTDSIDAIVIARFGAGTQPQPTPRTPVSIREFRALTHRREQIVEDRVREENRLESCRDVVVRKQIQANIRRLRKQEERLDTQIHERREADETLSRKAAVMSELKGVADKTTNTLLAHMPELGTVSRQQVASLAGLAPHPKESGSWRGRRTIYGGRAAVRRAMFMAAKSAARWCPVLSLVYNRLRENGKSYKQAIIAIARKLLVRINTLIKELQRSPQFRPCQT